MKKLTAGILTVMLGIVSANSADAAVASKLYVDQKAKVNAYAIAQEVTDRGNAITSLSNTLTTEIGKKVDTTTYEAKVQELEAADATFATKASMETELSKKQDNLTVTGGILTWDAATSTLGLTGIATNDSVTNLQNTVEKLDGEATVEGSVKKQIADAIANEVSRANGAYDAAGSASTAEQNAKDYADSLASNYDAAGAAATAEQNAKDYANGLAGNYATAEQGALAVAADTLSKGNKATLDALDQTYATDGQVATAKQEAIDAAAADATTKADAAEADAIAAAKTETESQISNLNLNELSRVPAECSDVKNYCVLTTNGSKYLWEVIERATDEAQPEGTDIPSVTDDSLGA